MRKCVGFCLKLMLDVRNPQMMLLEEVKLMSGASGYDGKAVVG